MKKIINNLSVRGKFMLIIGLNLIFLGIISVIGYRGLSKMDGVKNNISRNGTALGHQLTADMMHDALRADVYNALLVDPANKEEVDAVRADLKEHVDIFNEQIGSLNAMPLAPVIKEAVMGVEGPLADYVKTCQDYAEAALVRTSDSTSIQKLAAFSENFKTVFDKLADQMAALSDNIASESEKDKVYGEEFTKRTKFTMVILILLICILAFSISNYISRSITQPVSQTSVVLSALSAGENVNEIPVESKDELGNMVVAINSIVANMNNVKEFVGEVGKGNFNTNITIFNNNGEIYHSLNKMKESLKHTAEEDKKRNWTTEGLAKFADILRANLDDVTKFYDSIISNLVRYMDANQGGLYVQNEDAGTKSKYLELVACYAFQKKKFITKRIDLGEGLVGQCLLEGDTIFMTDVPEDYIEITSGLGDAPPRCILIVPLKVNDVSYGVVELAAFTPFLQYQIEFVQKVGESIASTISSVKVNAETKQLLEVSQQQSEEMRAQEEEMRQNLEEMQATQEEMQRKEMQMKELLEKAQQQEEEMRQNMEEMQATQEEMDKQNKLIAERQAESKGILDGIDATMATIEFTPDGHVLNANENFFKTMKCTLADIKGKHHSGFVPEDIKSTAEYKNFWSDLGNGIDKRGEFKRTNAAGETVWLNAIYNPIRNADGRVVKVIKFATDITAQKENEAELKAQLRGIEVTMATIEFKPDGTIVKANENFYKTMKCTPPEIEGKHHSMFVPKEISESNDYKSFWSRLAKGEEQKGSFKRQNLKGEVVWLNAIYNPIRNSDGKVIKVIKFATDITSQKK